jgi:outer membrane lipoprotein carrier protein
VARTNSPLRCRLPTLVFALTPLLALVVGSGAARAGECVPGVAEATTARIQAHYEQVRDLSARFEQSSESATFGGAPLMDPEPKRGEVVFAKPGRMRWTYQEPEQSVVVSDGKTLWIHDVESKLVTRFEVTSGFLSGAALQFLLGDGKIVESFEVRAFSCEAGQVTLDLLPRSDATYERLGLVVKTETGEVVATSVLDLFGNRTRIRFADLVTNADPPAKTFTLEIPEGVEVIDYAAPESAD